MKYTDKLWAMRERAYDEARRVLDRAMDFGPGRVEFYDAHDFYSGLVMAREVFRVEADRAWDEEMR